MSELLDVFLSCLTEKGQIIIDKEEYEGDADELMMLALDAGADDFVEEEDSYEILTAPEDFSEVRLKLLKKQELLWLHAEVTMIPQTYVELTDARRYCKYSEDTGSAG